MSSLPRVVESGLRSFACSYDRYTDAPLPLGCIVVVREGPVCVFGAVADVASGPEDPSRPLQPTGGDRPASEVFADNPHILPLLRTRLTAVACGYSLGEASIAALPPAPAPLMAIVDRATQDEVRGLAHDGAFLALLVAAPLADDQVIAATVRAAASAFDLGAHEFTVRAGKELARLLRADPARLATILRAVSA